MEQIEKFVDKALKLVDLERQAEIDESEEFHSGRSPQELEKKGVCLLKLKIVDMYSGLAGRTLIVLQHQSRDLLPANRFSPGDIVAVKAGGGANPQSGSSSSTQVPTAIVYRVTEANITIALEEVPEDLEEPIRLDRVANDVTYRRIKDALTSLRNGQHSSTSGPVVDAIFGRTEPQFDAKAKPLTAPLNKALDESQRKAVAFALAAKNVAVIHGPPGTGKTTAVVELIRQAVKRGDKVLVVAPSNIAVDNIVERLAAAKTHVLRLGHPARLLPSVLAHSLDAVVAQSDESKLVADVRKEMDTATKQIQKTRDRAERRGLRGEVRRLGKELREREEMAVQRVIDAAKVICATLTGAADRNLGSRSFDLVIIDEAAQALESACWIALLRGKRAVLAGDRHQLPPTVKSTRAEKEGFGRTLLDRLHSLYGDNISSMLTVQYRMHEHIMRWSSDEFYSSLLTAHASVAAHLLSHLPAAKATQDTEHPLVLIDTAGCDMPEVKESESESTGNDGEASVVRAHVDALVAAGVKPAEVGVITPYNAQVDRLRAVLAHLPAVEVNSVDGFQGREKEAIVISLVRSNDDGQVGFLADDRRTNVAVTRARRHVCVVADSETVGRHPFLRRMLDYFETHGDIRSAAQYTP